MLREDMAIISVDDHLIEPPDTWQSRLPAKFRDQGPRLVQNDAGEDCWLYEGRLCENSLIAALAGKDFSEFAAGPFHYADILPGCYDPVARLADMDDDGVAAQANFPNFARFGGTRFYEDVVDVELAHACVVAYNDFVLDEWCAAAPDRYIPLVIVPLWDPRLAAAEIERVTERGARGLCFPDDPAPLGLPSWHSHHWDPLLSAVQNADIPICIHFGGSGGTLMPYRAPDAPEIVTYTPMCTTSMHAMADLLFSPVFHDFPRLKFVLAEGGIGWIPYLLERADELWPRHRHYQNIDFDTRPSDLYRGHFWGCTLSDEFAFANPAILEKVGIDHIMLESDYPHSDTSWPHTRKHAEQLLADLPDDTVRKIAELNARQVYNFPAS